jgi:type II secretory pathway pseudopilin PulG
VAIALIISAVAVPNVIQGVRQLRLRSAASSVVGILQQARQRAVRDNRIYQVLLGNVPGTGVAGVPAIPMLFIDLNADGNYTVGPPREPLVELPGDLQFPAAAPVNNNVLEGAMSPGTPAAGTLIIRAGRPTSPTFNARGRVCQPGGLPNAPTLDGITACNTDVAAIVGYGIYLQSATLGNDGWAAVTVSRGGRIKRWRYDAGAGTWR